MMSRILGNDDDSCLCMARRESILTHVVADDRFLYMRAVYLFFRVNYTEQGKSRDVVCLLG